MRPQMIALPKVISHVSRNYQFIYKAFQEHEKPYFNDFKLPRRFYIKDFNDTIHY